MLLSRHQNAGKNHDVKIANRCFENVAQFKSLGATVTHENLMQEEIKRRLNSGNVCYRSVQNLCLLVCCLKTSNMQNCHFACGYVWVRNFVSDIKGRR
jgi:hypothetical protein